MGTISERLLDPQAELLYRLGMSDSGWRQLDLPGVSADREPDGTGRDESHCRRISGYLTVHLPEPVDVVLTENRSTMVSYRKSNGRLKLRLHRLFRHADRAVLDALARYVAKRDKDASSVIDRFIACHRSEIAPARARRKLRPNLSGRHHDLAAAFERVNRTYFNGEIEICVCWGRRRARRGRKRAKSVSRALGSYSFEDRTVRVSPVLDAEGVPEYVIDWIVYHELLHHVLPVVENGGKRQYHTRKFRMLERAFRQYAEAKAWEKKNLDRLLS